MTEQDMIPMIRSIRFEVEDPGCILIYARICCQNPTLNPAQLVAAVERYLPECKPDHSTCCRLEIYDEKGNYIRSENHHQFLEDEYHYLLLPQFSMETAKDICYQIE